MSTLDDWTNRRLPAAENRDFLLRNGVQIDPLPKEPATEEFYSRVRHLTGGKLNACAGALIALMQEAQHASVRESSLAEMRKLYPNVPQES